MAALGLQRVAASWFRLPFDALTYISVIVPEIVIALATLVFFASTIGCRRDRDRDRPGVEIGSASTRSSPAHVAVQHQPRPAARPGPAVGDGPDPRRGELRPVRDARGGRSGRSRSRSSCRRSSPGFLLSFTFSFDDYVITTFVNGPGTSTLPLYVFGQIKRA